MVEWDKNAPVRVLMRRRGPQWRREVMMGMGVTALSLSSLAFYGFVCRAIWRAMG